MMKLEQLVRALPLKQRPRVAILTGSAKAKEKRAVYASLADGSTDIVVGTHALITDALEFKKLGLAVIDEQHRLATPGLHLVYQTVIHFHEAPCASKSLLGTVPFSRAILAPAARVLVLHGCRRRFAARNQVKKSSKVMWCSAERQQQLPTGVWLLFASSDMHLRLALQNGSRPK